MAELMWAWEIFWMLPGVLKDAGTMSVNFMTGRPRFVWHWFLFCWVDSEMWLIEKPLLKDFFSGVLATI